MKTSSHAGWSRWLDGMFCRGMQAIAGRQEGKFPPRFLDLSEHNVSDPHLLFPEPPALANDEIRGAAWERQGKCWRRDFTFPSPLPTLHRKNDFVFVRTYAPERQLHLPAVIVLHGLMSISTVAYRPFLRAIAEAGASAYFLELPYHHRRTPAGSFSGDLFYTADFEMTLHAVRQAVADVRRLAHYLREAEAPVVGILGFSLGAWLAALAACAEPELDFALLAMPPAALNDIVWESPLGGRIRRQFENAQWRRAVTAKFYRQLDPVTYHPLLPRDRIEIFAAEHDAIIALKNVLALQNAWAIPRLHQYPAGHISIMLSSAFKTDATSAVQRQLAGGRALAGPVTVVPEESLRIISPAPVCIQGYRSPTN